MNEFIYKFIVQLFIALITFIFLIIGTTVLDILVIDTVVIAFTAEFIIFLFAFRVLVYYAMKDYFSYYLVTKPQLMQVHHKSNN